MLLVVIVALLRGWVRERLSRAGAAAGLRRPDLWRAHPTAIVGTGAGRGRNRSSLAKRVGSEPFRRCRDRERRLRLPPSSAFRIRRMHDGAEEGHERALPGSRSSSPCAAPRWRTSRPGVRPGCRRPCCRGSPSGPPRLTTGARQGAGEEADDDPTEPVPCAARPAPPARIEPGGEAARRWLDDSAVAAEGGIVSRQCRGFTAATG